MKLLTMRERMLVGLFGVLLLASGCQSNISHKPVGLVNPGFMSLWETYIGCRSTADFSQASSQMMRLAAAAQFHDRNGGFVLPLPATLERLVTNPTSRFAVDVQAMAAACSLHAGQLALGAGRTELARDVFASIIKLQRDESAYYVLQARTFLAEIERGVDISFKTH